MRSVSFDDLKKLPDGTLFTPDSPDKFVRNAIFVKGEDTPDTSPAFLVYEPGDLRKLQERAEFALKLLPHKTEYEP